MRKFGLIGFPLGHSFSRKYFTDKFEKTGLSNCQYSNYEIPEISALEQVLADVEIEGLNVTIPYKESVIPFLHKKDPVVAEISACNCIYIQNGALTGYNTDVIGFEESLAAKLTKEDKRALILGTGGSSKAVAWVLKKRGIEFLFVSRNRTTADHQITYEDLNRELIESHSLIVNSTPLGMSPKIATAAPIPYEWLSAHHYLFDLVYNPDKTVFLAKGEAVGARIKNGADMLAIQAEASWRIWNQLPRG